MGNAVCFLVEGSRQQLDRDFNGRPNDAAEADGETRVLEVLRRPLKASQIIRFHCQRQLMDDFLVFYPVLSNAHGKLTAV